MVQNSGYFSSLFFLFFAIVINQLQIPLVSCQEEQDVQCLPRKIFFALLRLPEVSSNLAAYSRTAKIIQNTRNDFVQLKALSTEDTSDDAKICLPTGVYYEIFSDPTMRAHLSAIERALRIIEDPGQDEPEILDSEKRSIATLAKNDDLPPSIKERKSQEDEEKRSESGMTPEELLKMYETAQGDDARISMGMMREYTFPNDELNLESLIRGYPTDKRNIRTLARDYALPSLRRNSESSAQEPDLQSDKRNIAALARERMLPANLKRNVASLGRIYILPSFKGKRNIGSLARDSLLPPFGKRYLGALVRSGNYPYVYGKRSIASLARNGELHWGKRNIGTLARDWSLPQSRHGRSLNEHDLGRVDLDLQRFEQEHDNDVVNKARAAFKQSVLAVQLADAKNKSRSKRQIDYSDEYLVPDIQNINTSEYDDLIEALAGYPIAEKRFMGRIPQMGPRPTTPPTRRLGR